MLSGLTKLLSECFWGITQFMLGVMEMFEFLAASFLGVGTTVDDYLNFADNNGLTASYMKTFKAVCGLAIVLMIIFTIMAIVRQEIANATDPNGFSSKQNDKTPIIMKLFKNIMSIIILPIAVVIIIGGVNSVLTAFRNAISGDSPHMTVAQTVLYTSSYDVNRARVYASSNKRVPAVIKYYDADQYLADENDKLYEKIESSVVQQNLAKVQNELLNSENSLSFQESLVFKNNKLINNTDYGGGNYESYICTPEQYHIIAEFTDYVQKTKTKYKIVPMDDESIEWKYVNDAVYDKDEGALTITYMDASDLNPEGEVYTITYSMSYEVTSPISNAMDSLEALLGVGDYENLVYNEMERNPDSVNVVQWANEKASLHFSKYFQLNDPKNWTSTDEILLYEYYHFATNNTFSGYKLDDFSYKKAIDEGNPVTLDVYKYVYREYYPEPDAYSPERIIYCVLINGNYYTVEKSQEEKDVYGDYYYVLKDIEGADFLETSYTTIYENTRDYLTDSANTINYNALIKLSDGFDLNDSATWTYTDEIIVYEYFKDLSYRNMLSKYSIADFKEGVRLKTYTISHHRELSHTTGKAEPEVKDANGIVVKPVNPAPKVYVLINDVYYEVTERQLGADDKNNTGMDKDKIEEEGVPIYELCAPDYDKDGSRNDAEDLNQNLFQELQESTSAFFKYAMNLNSDDYGKYFGISTKEGSLITAEDFIISSKSAGDNKYFQGDEIELFYYYTKIDGTQVATSKIWEIQEVEEGGKKVTKDVETSNSAHINEAFEEDLSNERYADFDLKFSSTFDYKDVKTWNYKDYFIFYLYSKYLAYSDNFSLDRLRNENGLSGKIGRVGIKYDNVSTITQYLYVYQIDSSLTTYKYYDSVNKKYKTETISVYLKMEDILNISEMNMSRQFDLDKTLNANDFDLTTSENLIIDTTGNDFKYSLLHTETESKGFKFSDSFNGNGTGSNSYGRLEDWTVEDYLLIVLAEKGYIDLKSKVGSDFHTADFSNYIYNAIVYKVPVDAVTYNEYYTKEEKETGYIRLYCFGSGENKIYINENYITKNKDLGGFGFESFDAFLETNLMRFVRNRLSSGEVISDAETISQSLYQLNNFNDYVFVGRTFIEQLVKEYIYNADDPMFKIYSDIVDYEYYNDKFNMADLTTWTKLDFILYYINGEVSKKNYKFNLIQDTSNKKYLRFNDKYAISIESGSPLYLNITSNTGNNKIEQVYEIESAVTSVSGNSAAKTHFNDNDFYSYVLEKNPEELMLTDSVSYKYKFAENAAYSKLDIMLIGLQAKNSYNFESEFELVKNKEHNFEVYNIKDYSERYIKLGEANGKFVLLKIDNENSTIFSCVTKSSIQMETNKVFTKTALEYVPFEQLESKSINILDAIVYNYTNSLEYDEENKYTVYQCSWDGINGNRYIVINGGREILLANYENATTNSINLESNSSFSGNQNRILDTLYEQVYSNYFYDMRAMSGLLSGEIDINLKNINFKVENTAYWSPLDIILYKNEIIQSKDGEQSIDSDTVFRLRCKSNGSKIYFYTEKMVGSELQQKFIDITNFVDIKLKSLDYAIASPDEIVEAITNEKSDEEYIFVEKTDATNSMFLMMALLNHGDTFEKAIDKFADIRVDENVKNGIDANNLANQFILTDTQNNMDYGNIATWTWFDMVYYYLFNKVNTNTKYIKYYSNGSSFVQVTDGTENGKNYYLYYAGGTDPLKCGASNKFTTKVSSDVSFDISAGEISKLGIVYNKITSQKSGKLEGYEIPSVSSTKYVYIVPATADNTQYIYGLTDTDKISSNSSETIKYRYSSSAKTTNIAEWTTFDLIIKSQLGNTDPYPGVYDGSILNISVPGSNVNYLRIKLAGTDNIYINLTSLGFVNSNNANDPNRITTEEIYKDTTKNISYKALYSNTKVIDLFGINETAQPSYDYNDSKQQNVFMKYSGGISISRTSDKFIKLEFSDDYVSTNEDTWDFSDYILQYIFEQTFANKINNYNKSLASNFDYYVKLGYVPATIYSLQRDDGTFERCYLIGDHVENEIGTADLNKYLFITKESFDSFKEYSYKSLKSKYAGDKMVDAFYSVTNNNITKAGMDMSVQLKFSTNFDFSDASTWTLSDYLLYYLFEKSLGEDNKFNYDHKITNFQYYVSQGYVPARIYYLNAESNEESGSLIENKVILIGTDKDIEIKDIYFDENNNIVENTDSMTEEELQKYIKKSSKDSYIFINYNLIYGLYSKPLYYTEYLDIETEDYPLKLDRFGQSIDSSDKQKITEFGVRFETKITSTDLEFDNYYYFKDNKNFFDVFDDVKVGQSVIDDILAGRGSNGPTRYVNLKLSKNFNIAYPNGGNVGGQQYDPWTVLDYIIIYEYSRNINNNSFYGLTYNDIKYSNLMVQLYGYILKVNGNFYNLEPIMSTDENATEVKVETKINSRGDEIVNNIKIETPGTVGYSYKVLFNTIKYNLKSSKNQITKKLTNDSKTVLYYGKVNITGSIAEPEIADSRPPREGGEDNEEAPFVAIDQSSVNVISPTDISLIKTQVPVTYYRKIDTNEYMHFQLSLTKYDNYKITPLVKKVNWPQKLMNDMKVIYPNLNWSNLVATDGWIDTLGDYFSGTTSGQFIASGNSSNITAVGMVLSEFFLSVAKETDSPDAYSDYSYESIFDESTIDALMLAMLGEYEYKALKMEAKVFVDMFNTGFAAVLDDVAAQRGITIKEGDTSNLAMSVYKSYLATAILSSDIGEYLYTVATRVYAQYTIYEAFAKAKGVYADYYAYIHGQADEEGNIVDAFAYASFKELTEHENKYLNDGDIPTFTFNMKSVLKELYAEEINGQTIDFEEEVKYAFGQSYDNSKVKLRKSFNAVVKKLNDTYKQVYLSGEIVHSPKVPSNAKHYCFMLDVYWTIKQELTLKGSKEPTYLQVYYKYITDSVPRWGAFDTVSINGGSAYVQHYNLYKALLYVKQVKVTATMIGCYGVVYNQSESLDSLTEEEQAGIQAQIEQQIDNAKAFIDSFEMAVTTMYKIFEYNDECYQYVSDLFPMDFLEILGQLVVMTKSQLGDMSCWNSIVTRHQKLQILLDEIALVMRLEDGEYTDMGSSKNGNVTDKALSSVYDKLSSYYMALNDYIGTQKIVDTAEKTSLTFTLAQFGNNYIEEGYDFTIDNSQYQMNTTVSAQRLAEYVYGGSFLVAYGVQPTYTSADFEGIIEITTAYDEKTGLAKKKLDAFTTLREFAKKVADYTGKLYYLTNLNDVAERTNDSMILTDYVYTETPNLHVSTDILDDFVGSSDIDKWNKGFLSSTPSTFSVNSNSYMKTTPEYAILDYIIANGYLNYDTLYNLLVVDNVNSDKDGIYKKIISDDANTTDKYEGDNLLLTLYENNFINPKIGGTSINIAQKHVDELQTMALRRYLWFIQSSSYKGVYNNDNNKTTQSERLHTIFKKVILYITGFSDIDDTTLQPEENEDKKKVLIDFKDMHFKDLKVKVMDALVDYVQYENSTGEENTLRYLALLYLASGEFNNYISTVSYNPLHQVDPSNPSEPVVYVDPKTVEQQVGRVIASVNKNTDSDEYDKGKTICYKSFGKVYYMRTRFRVDSQTMGMILNLAGLSNRPIEELVNLEYNELYDRNGCYDESKGDTFIYCTYDETTGKHFPILSVSKNYQWNDSKAVEFENFNKIYRNPEKYPEEDRVKAINGLIFESEFVDEQYAYPVIARGIVVAGDLPTAIKTEDGEVLYYRTNITITGSIDKDSLKEATVSSEVTTVGYTSYVPLSTFSEVDTSRENQQMMYSGANGNGFEVVSSGKAMYVQYTMVYNTDKTDENGAIMLYDNFGTYYNTSISDNGTYSLLMMVQAMVVMPILFKVLLVAMRRILDLMFLVLSGPLMIAMNSLEFKSSEGKIKNHRAFTDWQTKMAGTLLSAFGLVVSFNLFGIIVGTSLEMTYVTAGDSTMRIIESSPVMTGALDVINALLFSFEGRAAFVNFIVKFFFILVGTQMIQGAANLVGSLVTAGRVKSVFNSQLDNKDVFEQVTKIVKGAQMGVVLLSQLYSGELLENAMHAALKKATDMIPGSAILKKGIHIIQNQRAKKKVKALAKRAQEKGVSKGVADKLAKDLYAEKKKQIAAKKKNREAKAQAFTQTMQGLKDPASYLEKRSQQKEQDHEDSKRKSISRSQAKKREKKKKEEEDKKKGKKKKKKSGDQEDETDSTDTKEKKK